MTEMQFRYLGDSGLKVSALSYGNWVTHGGQIGYEQSEACIKKALDLGITTFDTADVYSETRGEQVEGQGLEGVRRESIELFSKVYFPTGEGPNDRGLSRKHIQESCEASLRRLRTDHLDLYQAHRFDTETPLEETMTAFADLVRQGKVLYVGVSEWTAEQIGRGGTLGREVGVPSVCNPAAVLDVRGRDRGGGRPRQRAGGARAGRVVADRPGRAHREVPPGAAA